MRAAVITCSDRVFSETYADRSGPLIVDALVNQGFEVEEPVTVPDEVPAITGAIQAAIAAGARVVVTTGGTGVAPRDVTVEATRDLLDYELPGIMEATRRLGAEHTPRALLSRGLAGVATCGGVRAVVINAPGSTGGARDVLAVAGSLLVHLVDQLDGGDH